MNSSVAIKVEKLSKCYKLYDKPIDRLKESLHPFRKPYHRDFYALNEVSFDIKQGETIGIIGKNGSGKSTLLKMITGVLTPSSGVIMANGKISALLELGAGFNPEFTGIENIYMNGTIMGFSKAEMDGKLHDIVDFADIGDFIQQPVKMYSSECLLD
jgi:ABC-type polysaccharide/polyol phosphate transport system ATPase subunit